MRDFVINKLLAGVWLNFCRNVQDSDTNSTTYCYTNFDFVLKSIDIKCQLLSRLKKVRVANFATSVPIVIICHLVTQQPPWKT